MKKITTLILAGILAVTMFCSMTASAAAPGNKEDVTTGTDIAAFEAYSNGQWISLKTPTHNTTKDGFVAYCMDHRADSPHGESFSPFTPDFSLKTMSGLYVILEQGYPLVTPSGLTALEARYATANAIRTWLAENEGIGYVNMMKPQNVRPKAGNQDVYDFYLLLVDKARKQEYPEHSISISPSTINLTEKNGVLTGTATVTYKNLNGKYKINRSKLPQGITVSGDTGNNGDVLTFTADKSLAGETINIAELFDGYDTRDTANIYFYETNASGVQPVVVVDNYSFYAVANSDITLMSENTTGRLLISKTSEDGKGIAGIGFKITGTTKGGKTFNAKVYTDNEGRVLLNDIPAGTYTISEITNTVPAGYTWANSQNVTVESDKTTRVTFHNTLLRGSLSIVKTSEDNRHISGIGFKVAGTSANGTKVELTVYTNAQGVASISNLLVGSYKVTEIESGQNAGYILPSAQNVTIEYNRPTPIKFHNAMQRGDLEIIKTSEDNRHISGIQFKVTGTSKNGTKVEKTVATDKNGKVTISDLPVGTYTVKELSGGETAGYILPADQTVTITHGNTTQAAFYNAMQKGSLQITKTSEDNRHISGIGFKVAGTSANGTKVELTVYTNAQGVASIHNLLVGSYKVTEIKSGQTAGYILPSAQNVTIEYNRPTLIKFHNVMQRGDLELIKTSEDGRHISGVEFRITGTSTNGTAVNKTVETDENGKAAIENLPVGTYTVKELSGKETAGYILPADQTVTITHGETAQAAFYNAMQKGSLQIVKTSEDNRHIENIGFKITGTSINGTVIEQTVYTDADGVAVVDGLPVGSYTVAELEGDETAGYILPADQTVTIAHGETAQAAFYNAMQKGSLQITKTSEDDRNIENIGFKITGTSINGTVIEQTVYTDADGVAVVDGLPVGSYTVAELESNETAGYILPADQTVTITYGNTTQAAFYNAMQRGDLELIKTSEDGRHISGVEFRITGTSTNGTAVNKTVVTDENGKVTISDLPVGTYTVKELNGGETAGYILPADQTVTITHGNTTQAGFYNAMQSGNLQITKTSEDDRHIENVGFKITGTSINGTTVELTVYTNAQGVAEVNGLPVGSYTVAELEGDETAGYILPADQTVTIAHGETAQAAFYNAMQKGSLQITKTSEDDRNIENIGFKITGTSINGTVIEQTVYTNADGVGVAEGLPVGTYTVVELASDENIGYLLPDAQETVITCGNTTEITFHNVLKKGRIEITKRSTLDGTALKGAIYGIYRRDNGALVEELVTDEEGYAISSPLPYGAYFLKEIQAPDRYDIDPTEYDVSVTEDGSMLTIDVEDEPLIGKIEVEYEEDPTIEDPQTPIETPDTGDRGVLGYMIALLLSAASVLILLIFGRNKKWAKVLSVIVLLIVGAFVIPNAAKADSITKEYTFTTTETTFSYDAPAEITEDGETYTKGEIDYTVISEKDVTEKETVKKEVEKSGLRAKEENFNEELVIDHNGHSLTLRLKHTDFIDETIKNRVQGMKATVSYKNVIAAPTAEKEREVTFYDEQTGKTVTGKIPFKGLSVSKAYTWTADVTVSCRIEDYNSSFYTLGDVLLPFNDSEPQLEGFESEILKALNLSEDSYRLTGSAWVSEVQTDEQGKEYRLGVYTGERLIADYTAEYEGVIELPDVEQYTAVLTYEGEYDKPTGKIEKEVTAKVTYQEKVKPFPIIPVAAGGTVAVSAILLILFFILRKKALILHDGKIIGKAPIKSYTVDVTKYRHYGEIAVKLPKTVTKKHGKTIRIICDNKVLTEVTYTETKENAQDVIQTSEEIKIHF